MARQVIDTTTQNPGWIGDIAKIAFTKANANFEELYRKAMLGGKNMLINCGIPINQRTFVGGSLAAGAYGYDCWKAGIGGCNVAINASTGVFSHVSGALQQVVESPLLAWGSPLTFSVENPTSAIAVSVGGATASIPAGSGRQGVTVTPTGSGNMIVQMTAANASYSRPQLERGEYATPFDVLQTAQNMTLCQWTCRVLRNTSGNPFANASVRLASQIIAVMGFGQMRATPAASHSGSLTAVVAGTGVAASAVAVAASSASALYLTLTVAGQTPGQSAYVYPSPGNDSVIILDAGL